MIIILVISNDNPIVKLCLKMTANDAILFLLQETNTSWKLHFGPLLKHQNIPNASKTIKISQFLVHL